MKHLTVYIIALIAICLSASCRKDLPEINDPANTVSGNFSEVFDSYWNGMNNNYVFWDIDATNWDQVYQQYKPLFAKLNLRDSNDVRKGYTYFKQMTAGLVDSHYDLSFKDPLLKDSSSINPAGQRKAASPDYHDAIDPLHFSNIIPQKYLDAGAVVDSAVTDDNEHYAAVSGTIRQEILYFYFSGFNLKTLYSTNEDNGIKTVVQYFFNKLKSIPNIKGVIIDVRGNGGGDLADLNFILGRMIDKRLDFGYTRSKQGNGRLDYSPWAPAFVTPQAGARNITGPIVMLADAQSVSMAEMTTMAVKALPNGHFVGERTWGATGPLTNNVFYNGGQFSTDYIKLVYTSSLVLKYRDGKIYEGVGFPPDVEVKYDPVALATGRDKQLEAAIGLIR